MTTEPPPIRVSGPAPATPPCRTCGAPLRESAAFCSTCGTRAGDDAPTPTPMRVSVGVGSGFRFGLGFFLAATLFGLISFLVSALIAGSLIAAAMAWISGSPGGQRFEGSGTARSEPFQLEGEVLADWTATSEAMPNCPFQVVLVRADSDLSRESIVDTQVVGFDSGEYRLRGLPATSYVADVTSECEWTLRFSSAD